MNHFFKWNSLDGGAIFLSFMHVVKKKLKENPNKINKIVEENAIKSFIIIIHHEVSIWKKDYLSGSIMR